MITADGCRALARYNAWQNRGFYDEAHAMGEAARRQERGAFWGSIEGTLSHVLWGDLMWMHRLEGWDRPPGGGPESTRFAGSFDALRARREDTDARILAWAEAGPDLEGELTWHSGATGRDVTRARALCALHMFNHQTHHRGQVHAMMTAAGRRLPDTDLIFMPEDA